MFVLTDEDLKAIARSRSTRNNKYIWNSVVIVFLIWFISDILAYLILHFTNAQVCVFCILGQITQCGMLINFIVLLVAIFADSKKTKQIYKEVKAEYQEFK